MDNKGRVSIPSRYREILQESKQQYIYLTNFRQNIQEDEGEHLRYIIAFPSPEWQKIEEMFAEGNIFDQDLRDYQRYIVSRAEECPLDRQGRILVPPILREYIKLSRDVVLVGAVRSFEIWDRAAYEDHARQFEKTFDQRKMDELFKAKT
jgi:transcriptional regulator MraZ